MTSSVAALDRDLHACWTFDPGGLARRPWPGDAWTVLDSLRRLVACDAVDFYEHDLTARWPLISQSVEDGSERMACCDFPAGWRPPYPDYWTDRARFLPNSHFERTGDMAVVRWSDFYTQRELRSTAHYADYLRLPGDRHAVYLPLPASPGRTRFLALARLSGRDFTERDVLLLCLLQPHLHLLYLDAQQRRRDIPRLTRREREVLQLAAEGLSNRDIARRLFISVSTVRKHMEHVFDRTGVRTRARAAALALPHTSVAHQQTHPPVHW